MVLEISATPYIFTFKIYDWQRLDMDGKPRPINVERAFKNLYFDRRGTEKVKSELVATQEVIEQRDDCKVVAVSTHRDHFFRVLRYEFTSIIQISTQGRLQL